MECKEQRRLSDAYFDAFKRQQWIAQRVAEVRQGGKRAQISVAEAQEEVALDEAYEAWQELNRHSCSAQCEPAD